MSSNLHPARRAILRLGGAAAASVLMGRQARAAAWKIPIGTQLWCVRKQLAADIPGTLSALGAMGYEAVELENAVYESADRILLGRSLVGIRRGRREALDG